MQLKLHGVHEQERCYAQWYASLKLPVKPVKMKRDGPLKLLFLHGNGGSESLGKLQCAPIAKAMTGGATLHCLEGPRKLTHKDIDGHPGLDGEMKSMAQLVRNSDSDGVKKVMDCAMKASHLH